MQPPADRDLISEAKELPAWRKVLPWVVAAGLLVFVLGRLDLRAFSSALSRTDYFAFVAFVCCFNVLLVTADSLATAHIYRRRLCSIGYAQILTIRIASYLPSIVNHHLGQAWLTYFVSRAFGVPLWRVAGATLLCYATTFGGLLLFCLMAFPFWAGRVPWVFPLVIALALAGAAYLLVIQLRPVWLRERQAMAPLFEAGVGGHLLAMVCRLPHLLVLFLGTWLPFLFFGVTIPWADAVSLVPPLMILVALPVTPAGLGTRDLYALEFFLPFALGTTNERKAAIVAATLCWACTTTLTQLLMAAAFVPRARRLLALSGPRSRRVAEPSSASTP